MIRNVCQMILAKRSYRLIFAFSLCTIFFSMVYSVYPIIYETNDEQLIMYYYAGYASGIPEPNMRFCSITFGYLITGLYQLFPGLPCHTFVHILVIFFSCIIFIYCLMETANNKQVPFLYALLLCLLFLCIVPIRSIVIMQFTKTSAFAGMAAISLIITFIYSSDRLGKILRCAAIVILCFFSHGFRPESFIPAAVFLGGAALYMCIKYRILLFPLVLTTVFVIATVVIDRNIEAYYERTSEWVEFNERTTAINTAKAYTSFGAVGSAQLGISETELSLLDSWNFLVEHSNTDIFNTIINASNEKRYSSIGIILSYAINGIKSMYKSLPFILLFLMAMSMLSLFLFYFGYKGNRIASRFFDDHLLLLFSIGLFHCFAVYLYILGRFPSRVFYMLILLLAPFVFILFCSSLSNPKTFPRWGVIGAIFCLILSVRYSGLDVGAIQSTKIDAESRLTTMETYAMFHPENFYIFDYSLVGILVPPFTVYEEEKPINLTFWGGADAFSPVWYARLRNYGMNELDYKSFLKDNVYYMSSKSRPEYFELFNLYMEDRLGVSFYLVDEMNTTTDTICIYKLTEPVSN